MSGKRKRVEISLETKCTIGLLKGWNIGELIKKIAAALEKLLFYKVNCVCSHLKMR